MLTSVAAAPAHRLAIVVSHPIQHFCPFYEALAASQRVHPRVFFASEAGARPYWDAGFGRAIRWPSYMLEGFEHEFLTKSQDPGVRFPARRLSARLEAFDPDAVLIYGFFQGISRDALRWARWRSTPLLLVADSELRQRRGALTRLRKRLMLPPLLANIDAFLTAGDCNEAYYRHYGVPRERMFRCPLPLDETRLQDAVRNRASRRETVRRALDLPSDAIVAIGVGKFIPRKRFEDAIRAVAALWNQGLEGRIYLVLAGTGVNYEPYRAIASALRPEAIRFAGFVPPDVLPSYYAASDLLVHPSEADAHPLATSEAVMCGLPVVASDRVGSVGETDDVQPGRNGFEYPCGDIRALAAILKRLTLDRELREQASAASRTIAARRGMDASIEGLLRACGQVSKRLCAA
jgi:glycosyltransferase involved in cell wall biosynthesis